MQFDEYETRLHSWRARLKESMDEYSSHFVTPYILERTDGLISILSGDHPDLEKVYHSAVGIFRVATDDYTFTESPLGDKLLTIIHDLIQDAKKSSDDIE